MEVREIESVRLDIYLFIWKKFALIVYTWIK